MTPTDRGGAVDNELIAWLVVTAGSICLAWWCGIESACLVGGGRSVALAAADVPRIVLTWPGHVEDPRLVFPIPLRKGLPDAWLLNVCVLVSLLVVTSLLLLARRFLQAGSVDGMAPRSEVQDQLSLASVRKRSRQTRPSLDPRRASSHELGLHLGRVQSSGVAIYGSVEDSYLYLGPPRSGKGVNLVIPQCLAAPGPVIVTGTRPDTLVATRDGRRDRGPVYVFDPQNVTGHGDQLRWSPVVGCADPLTAILRAKALSAGAKLSGVRDGEFWDAMAQAVVRCYLHAAALMELPVSDVLGWVSRPADPAPTRILRSHPGAAAGWGEELSAQSSADVRQRDSVWAGVRRAFDCLADPRVLATCSPATGDGFDPEAFLDDAGTLYLVGSSGAQLSVAPLVAALIEDIVERARRRAASLPQGRLDPPLMLMLDEAANIAPIPSLPSLLSDGGGSGITTVAVLQSLAQARSRWGEPQAETMWDAATIKVVLGGLAHAEDLSRISRLAGEVDDVTRSVTTGPNGRTTSTSVRRLPVLPLERLRGLPVGRAVVLARRARPVEAVLTPYWKR